MDDLPPRILRFRLRLSRVDYSIIHVTGKLLVIADALSRASRKEVANDHELEKVVEFLMEVSVGSLPATSHRLSKYSKAQSIDPVCSQVAIYSQQGWPNHKGSVDPPLRAYWQVRGNLSVCKDLLLYGKRIVVPQSLQKETLRKIHEGHQGIQKCCQSKMFCMVAWNVSSDKGFD